MDTLVFVHSFIFRKSLQDMEMDISIIIQGKKNSSIGYT